MRPKSKKLYQEFNGEFFSLDEKTGYWQHTKTRERMHRYVWKHYYGEIPKGFHIHHLDKDRSNNDISNLAMLSPKAHASVHKIIRSEETLTKLRENCEKMRPLTKAWHSSEKGREWHKQHFDNMRDKLYAKKEFVCEHCGKLFESVANGSNRFCSNACKAAYRRKMKLDHVYRTCEQCGKEFFVSKYSKQRFCSRQCVRDNRYGKKE